MNQLGENAALVYGMLGIVFLLLLMSMYFLVRAMRTFDPLRRMQEVMEDWERQRTWNVRDKKPGRLETYFNLLDERLSQAGLKRYLPKATVEVYLLCNAFEFVLVFHFASERLLSSLLAACMVIICNHMLVELLRYRNSKITEDNLLELLNLISDYSLFESEITLILYRAGQSMPYPLKEALTGCHLYTARTGDSRTAFWEMRRTIHHPLFQESMLLLELCSKNTSDYQKVIGGLRGMVHRYLKEEKEKQAVTRSLLVEAVILVAIALLGIHTMLTGFAGEAGISGDMAGFLFADPIGQIGLAIFGGIVLLMCKTILQFGKRG